MDQNIRKRTQDEMREWAAKQKAEKAWREACMPTWKPVFTAEQQQAHDDYVKRHNCPF